MIYFFDIDGTIADTPEKDYYLAEPDEAMIALVNMLYDQGHKIVIVTARGTGSCYDYTSLTKQQLKEWGVKYDELHFGKFITDWAQTPEEFLNEM